MKNNSHKTVLPKTVKVKLLSLFKDHRGQILNIANELFRSCALIKSKKNSIRANHYHKKDSHWSYMIKGKMQYYEENNGKIEKAIVKTGQMVYSAPGVPHAMKFVETSVFLALTTQKRLKGKYEKDTIPYEII